MPKLLKQSLFAIFLLVACLLAYCALPRNAVHDIRLGGTLFTSQSVVENFNYRRWVTEALGGDAAALESLVAVDCGGGAGCYDHGEVLVQLLGQVGDEKFALMAGQLKSKSRYDLRDLLAAGFEFGSAGRKADFPLTTKALGR